MPSWRAGPRKQALLDFVAAVTRDGGPEFVMPTKRIATFDNDGTLWVEQPLYTQFVFVLDRIRGLAPQNPDWRQDPVFRAAIENDVRGAMAGGNEGLVRRFAMIVHHDDGEREYAYDRQSHIGRLDRAMDEAPQRGWQLVSMKDDWTRVFPR